MTDDTHNRALKLLHKISEDPDVPHQLRIKALKAARLRVALQEGKQ